MHPKQKTYKNKNYLDFVKTKECLMCGISPVDPHHKEHANRNDFLSIPLCRGCHSEAHSYGCKRYEADNNKDYWHEIINLMAEFIGTINR
jgi:hypothetical protein